MTKEDKLVVEEFKNLFPDGIYDTIKNIKIKNADLYNLIEKQAKKHHLKPKDYLDTLGFSKNNKSKSKYDYYNLHNLLNKYNIKASDIAEIFNCSRQNISAKIAITNYTQDNLWIIPLSQDEIKIIVDNLYENKICFFSNEFSYMIFDKTDVFDKKALLLRHNNTIKLLYELPDEIQNALKNNNLDIFSSEEKNFITELNAIWEEQGKNIINNQKQIYLTTLQKNKAQHWAEYKHKKLKEYFEFLGFQCIDKRILYSESDIIAKIKKYSDSNNCISLKVEDDDYHFFATRAYRNNKSSIYDFFKHYGFRYQRGRYVGDIYEKHKKIISERYVVTGNTIYISSYDPYYRTIAGIANNKNKTFDEIVSFMGFKRIKHKRDLPDSYVPFDYSKELLEFSTLDYDNISTILSLLSNEDNEVFLDVTTYTYYIIFLRAKLENISITKLVENHGYKRVFHRIFQEDDIIEENNEILNRYEDVYRHKLLNELKELESSFSLNQTEITKLERNKKLVTKLKDLYQCKCQLCNPDNPLPPICLDNGEIYSEVHHITSLHVAKSNEDIQYIDSYKNTIVLCPYHHKYVHLHNGGFNILSKDDDDILYLQNKKGEQIQIYINYHLSVN